MTALGHCSHQVEGDRKLIGQPLVHPRRLGSLVGVSSCFLVRDEQELAVHSQSSTSCWGLLDWACLHGLVPLGRVVCVLQKGTLGQNLPNSIICEKF